MVVDSHTNGTSVGTRTYDTNRVLAFVDHEPTEFFLTQIMDMGDEIYKAVAWKAPSDTFTAGKKPKKSGKGSGQYAVKLHAPIGNLSFSIRDLKEWIGASDDEVWVSLDDGTKLPVQPLVTTDAVKAMSSSATDVPTWLVLTFGHCGEDGGLAKDSLVSTAVTRGPMADFAAFFKRGDETGKHIFKDEQVSHDTIKNNVMRLFAVADDDLDNNREAVRQGGNNEENVPGGDDLIDLSPAGSRVETDAPELAPLHNRVTDDQVVVGPPSYDEAHEAPPANPEEEIRNLEEEIRNLKEARDVRTAYIEKLESTIFGMIRAHNNYVNNCVNSGGPINDDLARQEFGDCVRQFNAGSEEARMAIAALAAAADAAAAASHCVTEICNELDLSLDGGSLVGQPDKKRTVSGRDASSTDSSADFDSQSVTSVVSDDGSFSGLSTGSNSPSNGRSTHWCTACGTMSVIDDDPSPTGSTPFDGWRVYWCTTCRDWSFVNGGPSTGRDLGEAEPPAKRQCLFHA